MTVLASAMISGCKSIDPQASLSKKDWEYFRRRCAFFAGVITVLKMATKGREVILIGTSRTECEVCESPVVMRGLPRLTSTWATPGRSTLNQRAVGSTPTRPTKFFNNLHYSSPVSALLFVPCVLNLCPLCSPDGTSLAFPHPRADSPDSDGHSAES
jgi:hypothetical protein